MGDLMNFSTIGIGVFAFWFCSAARAGVIVKNEPGQITFDIEIEGLDMMPARLNGEDFLTLRLRGVGDFGAIKYSVGDPELPVVRFFAEGDVVVEPDPKFQSGVLKDLMRVRPSQPSWSKSESRSPDFVMNTSSYLRDAFMSGPRFDVEEIGSYRGLSRKMVTLYPLDYNPATGGYRLTNSFRIKIRKYPPQNKYNRTIAVISGSKYERSQALERLKSLKRHQGFEIRSLVVGKDVDSTPKAIRDALRGMYLKGENLEFAIIVGDISDVPSHQSKHIFGVTDHYFRSIDTEQYEEDIASPDIGIGRLSVGNERELEDIVGKIERYAVGKFSTPELSDGDLWLRYPSFIATHDRYQVAEATHNAVITEFLEPKNYERFFPDDHGKGGDKLYPISFDAKKSEIVEAVSQGRFIINFSGHGSHTGWEDLSANDVVSLNHPSALPWVLSNSCITGDFREEPVFAETWLRHPRGAISFWGSMDSTYWDEDDILERAVYREVYDRGLRTFDLIYQGALSEVWRFYGGANRSKYYWETYVTFGDPSLGVRIDRPRKIRMDGPRRILIGQKQVRWLLSEGELPLSGVEVVLLRESDGRMAQALTDADGYVDLDLNGLGESADVLNLYIHGPDVEMLNQEITVSEN